MYCVQTAEDTERISFIRRRQHHVSPGSC